MIVGYARTSTTEQQAGFDAQIADLEAAGCEKIFKEQVSAAKERAQLDLALDFVRDEKDVLVVTKLDRLARSIVQLWQIIGQMEKKGAGLRILNLGLDTTTPTGRLMLSLLGSIAQFEREMMLERQRDGIAAAKKLGKYKGRKATARAKSRTVLALVADNPSLTRQRVAELTGISIASVYRILSESGAAPDHLAGG